MPTPRLSLTQRAQAAAAHIGFTARRWWRDPTDPFLLHVEVERHLVGAPPAVATLTILLPPAMSAQSQTGNPILQAPAAPTRRQRSLARGHQTKQTRNA